MGRNLTIRQLITAALAVVCLLAVSYMIWLVVVGTPKEQPQSAKEPSVELNTFSDSNQNISLGYPTEATEQKLSPKDVADKFIFRAGKETDKPYLITLKYEDGLRTASQLSKTDTIDLLLANIDKAYPVRYSGFKKLSENKYEHEGKEAAVIEFVYSGPSGKRAYQKLNIFLRDENIAYYLSQQSREADKASLTEQFNAVADSFRFQASNN